MRPRHLPGVQALRGLAILMVVAYHLYRVEEKFLTQGRLLPDRFILGGAGVDLFFVISGFIMVWTTAERPIGPLRFLWNRATRIYPLYWFYSSAVLAVFFVRPEWVNASQNNSFSWSSTLILLPDTLLPLLMVGWSLVYEAYFYAVFALLLLLAPGTRLHCLLAWPITLAAATFLPATDSPFLVLTRSPIAFEFVIGALAAYAARSLDSRLPPVLFPLGMTLFAAAAFSAPADLITGLTWRRALTFGIPAGLLVLGAARISDNRATLLGRIGDASYSTYLSHLLVLSAIGRLAQAVPILDEVRIILLIAMLLLVLMVGELSYQLIELPLVKFFRMTSTAFHRTRYSSGRGADAETETVRP